MRACIAPCLLPIPRPEPLFDFSGHVTKIHQVLSAVVGTLRRKVMLTRIPVPYGLQERPPKDSFARQFRCFTDDELRVHGFDPVLRRHAV